MLRGVSSICRLEWRTTTYDSRSVKWTRSACVAALPAVSRPGNLVLCSGVGCWPCDIRGLMGSHRLLYQLLIVLYEVIETRDFVTLSALKQRSTRLSQGRSPPHCRPSSPCGGDCRGGDTSNRRDSSSKAVLPTAWNALRSALIPAVPPGTSHPRKPSGSSRRLRRSTATSVRGRTC